MGLTEAAGGHFRKQYGEFSRKCCMLLTNRMEQRRWEVTKIPLRQAARRVGCQVDEGNRRVAERLKRAERKGEDGELSEAWRWVRLSLERLYTVVYAKYGPDDFNPLSWLDQTAIYMWDNGAGEIIERKVLESGRRLKEILGMAVAGAHDKSPKGLTDLANAINDIRVLLRKLRVGG